VKRDLVFLPAFERAVRRVLKKDPSLAEAVGSTLKRLEEDAFHPQLRTHKLKGCLEGSWACSAGYDLRIVFHFVQQEGREVIALKMIGSHEEVY
jgi:mRNA-degrading endonuclease YafQ of YafQ-DinJ toxin-antitoxin module